MDRLNDFMSVLTGHFNNKEQYERLKTENEKFPYARHVNTICNDKIRNLPEDFAGYFMVEESYYTIGGKGINELGRGGHVVALIGGDQFAALGLVRVLPVVQAVLEGFGDGFSLADMVGNQARGCRSSTSSLFRKLAASQPPVRYGTKCPKGQPVIKLCREYFSE